MHAVSRRPSDRAPARMAELSVLRSPSCDGQKGCRRRSFGRGRALHIWTYMDPARFQRVWQTLGLD
jgi:hypothetical protein